MEKSALKANQVKGRNFLLSCLLLFWVHDAALRAQETPGQGSAGPWKIVIADSLTRKPLSFVSIQFPDTHKGMIADVDGSLTIHSTDASRSIQITRIGYAPRKLKLSQLKDTVLLSPRTATLEEFVVTDKDESDPRADWIIRQAIAHKPTNDPDGLHSYTYNSYNKMTVDTLNRRAAGSRSDSSHPTKAPAQGSAPSAPSAQGTTASTPPTQASTVPTPPAQGHVFMIESVIEHAYRRPALRNETVKAQRISGFQKGWLLGLATQLQNFSFYPDEFALLGVKYLNPLSRKYAGNYVFHLSDSVRDENGELTWIISFRPHRRRFGIDLLKGELHIHESDFAIANVIAAPATNNGQMNIAFRQHYDRVKGVWFPAQLNTDISFLPSSSNKDNEGGALLVNARSYLRDISTDSALSRKHFGNYRYSIDPAADDRSNAYWEQHRTIPLDSSEKHVFHFLDSLVHADPGIRKATMKLAILGDLASGQIPMGKINLKIGQVINYNRYEGLRLGAGFLTNTRFDPDWTFGIYAGYGFIDKSVKYGGLIEYKAGPQKEVTYGASYKRDIALAGANAFETSGLFNFQNLLAKKADSLQMVEVYRKGWLGKKIQTRLSVDYQRRDFTQGFTFEDPKNPALIYRNLQLIEAGLLLTTSFRQGFLKADNFSIPTITGDKGHYLEWQTIVGKALNSGASVDYQKTEARYTQHFSLGRPGQVTAILQGGKIWGHLPYTMLFSNLGSYDNFSVGVPATFQTMRWYEFVNDAYAALFLNYETGYLIQKHKKYGLSALFSQNTGIGSLSSPQLQLGVTAKSMNKGYTEAGFGLRFRTPRHNYSVMSYYRYGGEHIPNFGDNLSWRLILQ
jgi:hypothetical protein